MEQMAPRANLHELITVAVSGPCPVCVRVSMCVSLDACAKTTHTTGCVCQNCARQADLC